MSNTLVSLDWGCLCLPFRIHGYAFLIRPCNSPMNAFIKPCPFENMRDINRLVAVTYNFNVETIWMMLEQIKMIVFKK